jgi:hypothetical protein
LNRRSELGQLEGFFDQLNRVRPKPFRREFPGNAGSDGEKARVRIGQADSLKKLNGA